MISPFKGRFKVTSIRGNRTLNGKNEYHKGIDLVGLDDITVYAVCDGKVRTAYQKNGAGNYVVVTMADGRRVFYMHLKSFLVKNGAEVKCGEPVGIMGNTGYSFGAHTHLELRPAGTTSSSLDICSFTGIENKKGTYFYESEREVNDPLTEEQFENMLDASLGKRSEKAPSEWSAEARAFCEENGIIMGDGSGHKSYKSFVTREEMAIMLKRLFELVKNTAS